MNQTWKDFGILIFPLFLGVWLLWFAPETILGLDSGILGSIVVSYTAWSTIFMTAMRPLRIGQGVSPAERQAWVGLTFSAIIYIYFLTHLGTLSGGTDGLLSSTDARRAGQTLALLAIGWAVVSLMIRPKSRGEVTEDERDREIAARASDWAHAFLVIGLIATVLVLGLSPRERLDWATPRSTATMIINLLILKTLLEHNALVVLHWWGRR